ncbi:energy transducer TonB family protein [Roseibium marinum]|uniref:Protein TonB n=1 Tax=Roseibium marinum TaxID=281252 RepID=A0A2S3UL10_9HYPH|nr:energy transducer TonB [Roseibium marinum]POF28375.1 protein TonB [Roseibium marinum]
MKTFRTPLIIALAVSLAIHLLAVAMTLQSRPDLEIEGAGEVLHAVLGQSPFDTLVAGTIAQSERTEPVETQEVQTPVEPETATAKPVETARVARVEPLDSVKVAVPVQTVEAIKPVQPRPSQVSASLAASSTAALAIPVTPKLQPESPAAVQQVETVEAGSVIRQPAPARPAEQVSAAAVPLKAVTPEALPPSKVIEAIVAEAPAAETGVSAPRTKPEPPAKQVSQVLPDKAPPPDTAKPAKPLPRAEKATSSGAGGKSAKTTPKGGSQRKGKAKTAGNSDVTNYPAKVHRKLMRSVRAVGGSRRAKGDAVVRFTVHSNGSVASVRLARSSGSKPFDQAALKAVSRAAPFPPIPSSAGRSSWTFTLPVAMR